MIASLSLTVGSRDYDYRVACVIASLSLTVGSRVYDYRIALLESDSRLLTCTHLTHAE